MNTRQRIAIWVLRAIFLPVGLLLVTVPIAILHFKDDWALVNDTRALFGAGHSADTDPTVPVVHGVSCRAEYRSLRSTDRSGAGFARYGCEVWLAPAWSRTIAKDDPFKGRRYDDGMAEWRRRATQQMDLVRERTKLGSLERALVTDHDSEGPDGLPELRRLSQGDPAAGEPPRYGVVWGPGELLLRWLAWLAQSLLFFGLGGAALYAVWKAPTWVPKRE